MFPILKEYINQLKNNRYLRNTTILFASIGLATFVVFTTVVLHLMISASRDIMKYTEHNYLQVACDTGDTEMRDLHAQMSTQVQTNSVFNTAMKEKPYPLNSTEVSDQFNAIMTANDLIDSIYIINFKHNTVYSSNCPRSTVDKFFDTEAITLAKNYNQSPNINIPRTLTNTFDGRNNVSKNYITYMYSYTADSICIVNILSDDLLDAADFITADVNAYQSIITNRDGIVLASSDSSLFNCDLSQDEKFKDLFDDASSDMVTKTISGFFTFIQRSSQSGCYYIHSIDTDYILNHTTNMVVITVIFMLCLLLAYIIASIYCTRLTLTPIYNIKNKLTEITNYNQSGNDNEIEQMHDAINIVAKQNREFQTLQHNLNTIRRKDIIRFILTGGFSYDEEELASLGITLNDREDKCVLFLRLDHGFDVPVSSLDYIKYGIINIAEELFAPYGNAYFIEWLDVDICGWINIKDTEKFKETLLLLQKYTEEIFNLTLTVSYDTCNSAEDIVSAFQNARYAASFRMMKGRNSIISYNDVISQISKEPYPEKAEKALLAAIKTANSQSIKDAINDFLNSIAYIDYDILMLYIGRLVLSINQINTAPDSESLLSSPLETMSKLETLDDVFNYISGICENIALSFSSAKTDSKKSMIIDNIIDFIDNHYTDPQLSIDMIATSVSRSANYARSIFKQQKNISISEYIQKIRFDELCRLLRETNLPAQELGKRVGLSSGSYFYTAFKKHTGYTPDQYRTLHTGK